MRNLDNFGDNLINWWEKHGRRYPWRETDDPYKVFIAEILLHRTRAESVLPVYLELVNRYESFQKLYTADETSLHIFLKSLGLKWRVTKLIESVRLIVEGYDAELPMEKYILQQIPGIGDYIASAILTMLGKSSEPLIDTNTVRVIARLMQWGQTDSLRRAKKVRYKYVELRGNTDSKKFGLSLIDLAFKICRPTGPLCENCPVTQECKYFEAKSKLTT